MTRKETKHSAECGKENVSVGFVLKDGINLPAQPLGVVDDICVEEFQKCVDACDGNTCHEEICSQIIDIESHATTQHCRPRLKLEKAACICCWHQMTCAGQCSCRAVQCASFVQCQCFCRMRRSFNICLRCVVSFHTFTLCLHLLLHHLDTPWPPAVPHQKTTAPNDNTEA